MILSSMIPEIKIKINIFRPIQHWFCYCIIFVELL